MSELGFHLVLRASDGRALVPTVAAQRALAACTHRIGERYGLYAFRVAGDHFHLGALCPRPDAARFAQALGSALTQTLGVEPGFAPARLTPIADQRHLERAFFYIHRNTEKHGVANDPLHEASAVPSLLGMREVPGPFLARVRAALPKLDRNALLELLGVRLLEPLVTIDHLADAAAGAIGRIALDRSGASTRARGAAVRIALPTVPLPRVAEALRITDRAVRALRARPAEPLLERAIGLRMAHRAALGDRARLDLPLDAPPGLTGPA